MESGPLVKNEATGGVIRFNKNSFVVLNIAWPVVLITVGMSWIIVGGLYFVLWTGHCVKVGFYYIAAGGIAKFLGLA